mmetsp:Transcript_11073/g.32116  ORF Transcript_11073/g.32116 Transcript_11073/m.32116 type:complete len:214 (-) Transcript_11073:881-1522(-)
MRRVQTRIRRRAKHRAMHRVQHHQGVYDAPAVPLWGDPPVRRLLRRNQLAVHRADHCDVHCVSVFGAHAQLHTAAGRRLQLIRRAVAVVILGVFSVPECVSAGLFLHTHLVHRRQHIRKTIRIRAGEPLHTAGDILCVLVAVIRCAFTREKCERSPCASAACAQRWHAPGHGQAVQHHWCDNICCVHRSGKDCSQPLHLQKASVRPVDHQGIP